MNNVEKILKVIGLKPNQEFSTSDNFEVFRVTEDLEVQRKMSDNGWDKAGIDIKWLLLKRTPSGSPININIVKTKEESIVIDYVKLCGFKWLTKDRDGSIWAFKEKPTMKDNNKWCLVTASTQSPISIRIYHPLDFLSWEDEEPHYIGG